MGFGGVWVVVGVWVALISLAPTPTAGWIPFFGQELHKHLNLESHHRGQSFVVCVCVCVCAFVFVGALSVYQIVFT